MGMRERSRRSAVLESVNVTMPSGRTDDETRRMESQETHKTTATNKTGDGNGHAAPATDAPPARLPQHHNVPRLNDPNQPPGKSHWWVWLIVLAVIAGAVVVIYPRLQAKL